MPIHKSVLVLRLPIHAEPSIGESATLFSPSRPHGAPAYAALLHRWDKASNDILDHWRALLFTRLQKDKVSLRIPCAAAFYEALKTAIPRRMLNTLPSHDSCCCASAVVAHAYSHSTASHGRLGSRVMCARCLLVRIQRATDAPARVQ